MARSDLKVIYGERSVKVLLLPPSCEVCGKEAHPKFLSLWNGKDVCKYCIREINEEAEAFGY